MTATLAARRTTVRDDAAPGQGIGLIGFAYIAPAVLMYGYFFLWPFVQLLILSLQSWDGFGPREFVGIENYRDLIDDRVFWTALRHNLLWAVGAVIVPVLAGLLLAILLTRTPARGKTMFRAVYFLPQVISSISVAVAWGWIYNPTFGLLNEVLGAVGLESAQRGWLGDKSTALLALFIAWSWIHYGFTMVIFIAALEGVDEALFEAAKIDGAGRFAQFRYILVPAIKRPFTTVLLVTVISAFQVFDIIFALTNGGPGRATMVIPLYMLDSAFTFHKIGYGAAIAVVLAAIIFVVTMLIMLVRRTVSER